jgi:pyruvate, water dikinase
MAVERHTRWLDELDKDDVALVGGKNASLGEMLQALRSEGIRVPGGFATTAAAYHAFVDHNDLRGELEELTRALGAQEKPLHEIGERIRRAFRRGRFPEQIAREIRDAYVELSRREGIDEAAVAVRSSATAEDLPEASFAGQQDSYLNVRGADDLLARCRDCYASLFTDRAIVYRETRGFDHLRLALSVGVQKMVRADKAGAGVMFSLDTDTGFPLVVLINAAWGLGETVVQGRVNPDEYRVFKPRLDEPHLCPIIDKVVGSKEQKLIYATNGAKHTKLVHTPARDRRRWVLSNDEILTLARWAVAIERHYGMPMDMEWAKDGETDELYCVQARPETVHSRRHPSAVVSYRLLETKEPALTGIAIGQSISTGPVRLLHGPDEMDRFEDGDVLVTERTDPDWGPIMKRASAIVTDHGGRTSHAAIVSRELGIPAIVGTDVATERLRMGQEVTVSCAEGERGRVYDGLLKYAQHQVDLDDLPEPPVRIMINVATPNAAMRWWNLPVRGIGLARMEFIINNIIKIHPLALCRFDRLQDTKARETIERMTEGSRDKSEYFVEHLARGIATIAASQYPHRAIVRTSDFKTNEYATLIGGAQFEPHEENPMLGFRGASRYYSEKYRDGFALECRAIVRARESMGLDNIIVMLPFVRTPEEADRVLDVMAENGLARGRAGLEVYMMCEIPSNVFLAEEFAERFDGFSIGSNDLTQLVLGVDRDAENLGDLFDERSPAVYRAISRIIEAAHTAGLDVGICGQAPSDYPDFARFLVEQGIDSISLAPDSVIDVIRHLADARAPGRRTVPKE